MDDQQITPATARLMLETERRERLQAANAALEELQQKFSVRLVGIPQITPDGRIVCTLQLVDVMNQK